VKFSHLCAYTSGMVWEDPSSRDLLLFPEWD